MHTVKDHKPKGKVAFRAIHSSASHAFTGMMSWFNLVMDQQLWEFKHVLVSCDQLLAELNDLEVQPDTIIVHFDLKDLFMQGSVDFLAHHACLMVPNEFRAVF